MLKFLILDKKCPEELISQLAGDGKYSETEEIVSSFFSLLDDGCEVGFARLSDILLVRIFDGEEYVFIYPIALSDGLDERDALAELRAYAVREEIPLVLCDVPEDSRQTLEEAFRFTEIHDDDGCLYAVVKSELSMLCEPLSLSDGVISLTPLSESDIKVYAEICKNEEINRYWGYDYREDIEAPKDECFYLVSEKGRKDGTSLSLGIRYNGHLIGEGCFWGFDLMGGAEVGFRILPKWQSQGFGRRALKLLISLGEEMGLISLYATVKKENTPSVRLLDSLMEKNSSDGFVNKYIHRY